MHCISFNCTETQQKKNYFSFIWKNQESNEIQKTFCFALFLSKKHLINLFFLLSQSVTDQLPVDSSSLKTMAKYIFIIFHFELCFAFVLAANCKLKFYARRFYVLASDFIFFVYFISFSFFPLFVQLICAAKNIADIRLVAMNSWRQIKMYKVRFSFL